MVNCNVITTYNHVTFHDYIKCKLKFTGLTLQRVNKQDLEQIITAKLLISKLMHGHYSAVIYRYQLHTNHHYMYKLLSTVKH